MSLRAFLLLTGYNGFRGSICVTNVVELIKTFRRSCLHEGDRFNRVSLLRGLREAKPDECLSNISHELQTYVETNSFLT